MPIDHEAVWELAQHIAEGYATPKWLAELRSGEANWTFDVTRPHQIGTGWWTRRENVPMEAGEGDLAVLIARHLLRDPERGDLTAGDLTTAQVARALGVEPRTVVHHCRAGHLPGARRHGRDWVVPGCYAEEAVYRAAVGPRRGAGKGA